MIGAFFIIEILAIILWLAYRIKTIPAGYKVIGTPYPKLGLYGTQSPLINTKVKRLFCHRLDDPYIEDRLREILGHDHELTWSRLRELVRAGEYYLLRPKRPGRIFAWAQTASDGSKRLILGFEVFLSKAGWLRNGAIFHELCHCAQEIREKALTREWGKTASRRQWLRLEFEAHLYAWIWPLLTGLLIAFHWVLIRCW